METAGEALSPTTAAQVTGGRPRHASRGLARLPWVLLAYLALSLLLTWPLVTQLGSHVLGDGIDDPSLAWNLWWAKHALVDQPQNPFNCTWIFWPVGINLAFYTLTLLNGALSIPLQSVFGVVPAYNVLLLSSFVLGGYGAYLLCRDFLASVFPGMGEREGGEPRVRPYGLAAFIGGALYAFASAKLFYASLGQGNVASSQWAPFAALYLVRLTRPQGRPRDSALAALFLVFQAYAEQTYASFLVIFAALLAVYTIVLSLAPHPVRNTHHAVGITSRLALAGLMFLAGIVPFLANMLPDLRAEGDFFTSGGGFADVFSADLAGYLVPTQLHPLLGGLTRQFAANEGFPIDKGQQIYVGYTALALAIFGLVRGTRRGQRQAALPSGAGPGRWFWALAALLFFLLTLGPALRVAGHDTGIPLPFALVEQLPFFKGNRYPSRYSVMLLLCLAPLVALGIARLTAIIGRVMARPAGRPGLPGTRRAAAAASAFLLALLLFEHLSTPLPLFDLTVPALYQRVAQEPGDFALLEIPPGWRNGARVLGKQDVVIMQEMWYQTAHGKRLLGGNTSRNPEFKFQYFAEDPTLARLIAQTNADDLQQHDALRQVLAASPVTDADRARAASWAAFVNVRYVMVHRDKIGAATERTLRDLLPVRLVAQDGNLALYAVDPAATQTVFDLNTPAGQMALAEGWSPPGAAMDTLGQASLAAVWAERPEVRLLLPLPPVAASLVLEGQPAMIQGQRLTVVVNGRATGTQEWDFGQPITRTFAIPADPRRPLLSDVRLRFAQMTGVGGISAHMQPPGPWGALPNVLVRSAGTETGDFAHIYVNGVDVSPNGRGYNLFALDRGLAPADIAKLGLTPADVEKLGGAAASFDTHADPAASARLAAWIAALPPGAVVAGAVRDEASMSLGPDAVAALARLGVTGDLRGHFRWGHAFISVKGAEPGWGPQAMSATLPAQVSLGVPASAPEVAAGFTRVTIVALDDK